MHYVYGCDAHPDVKEDVTHGMTEDPVIPCPECKKPMHRIPQVPKWRHNPQNVLLDQLDKEYQMKRRNRNAKRG